uniref:Uncharacterized protein n=1 Tax=Sphaerodactylus townsendi TaxID=933632 RepID=A0ACB8FUX9_9SAUR
MGEGMSKRLKLQLGGEAEMEERAFGNPYSDYPAHGVPAGGASEAASPSGSEAQRDSPTSPEGDDALPFDGNGKRIVGIYKKLRALVFQYLFSGPGIAGFGDNG